MGSHEKNAWSRAGVPYDTVELKVFHSIPAVLEDCDGTSETVVHLLEIAHVLNYDDERAQRDSAEQHALTGIETATVLAAVVVVRAAALALQCDGDDVALIHR